MKHLQLFRANDANHLAHPAAIGALSTRDSALEVFTDFHTSPALIVNASLSVLQAESMMKTAHVRLKIVVDKGERVVGVVSLDDLSSQEVIKRISQGFNRSELKVADFMRPLSALRAFSWSELQDASIQDVIDSLEHSGQQHCLVVDRKEQEIRGIISASDIARKLKLPIDIHSESNFARISHVIYQQINPQRSLVNSA